MPNDDIYGMLLDREIRRRIGDLRKDEIGDGPIIQIDIQGLIEQLRRLIDERAAISAESG